MSTSEALNTDIREITEQMGKVDINGPRQVQFLCTCSLNEGDCTEARERIKREFLRFANAADTYLRQTDQTTGEPCDGCVSVVSVRYQAEAGDRHRRAHVHAVIVARGRGKVSFDLRAIRRDFPRMYWHFDYSRQPRPPEQALQNMIAYAGKSISRRPGGNVSTLEVSPESLVSATGVTHVGTTSDINRTRRVLEKAGGAGVVRYAPLTTPTILQDVLETHRVWSRRPKKTASFVYVVSPT